MNLLIIGAGNMGLTYGQSFVNASAVNRSHLFFLDRNEERAASLTDISHNPLHMEASNFIKQMDLIILSVKPQDFDSLAMQIRPYMQPHQLILSIMAGITIEKLRQSLGIKKLVRAMPNLPAQVGQGMTVFTASDEVSR
ncbi:MAG: NAD(P)-binding domain-containing protein, partial [Bacteroidota bacterium]